VRAYRLVATQGEPGETYNVASGVDRSMSDVAQMLLDAVGAQIELSVDLNLLRPVDVPVLRGDANKLRAATGWQPEMDFVTTINDVVAELVL